MNQNTRPMYDKISTKNRAIITTQPLRYIIDPTSEYKSYVSPTPENIDTANDLRMKPTRLNYYNRPETELYGTAPYQTLGHRNAVDTESNLFFGNTFSQCDRVVTERTWNTFDPALNVPLAVDTALRPVDTQAQLRNSYCAVSKQK
tara:strand:- start:47 stop:484 length:438 start_codon:yes stop_codon:yes gene_type:complete